MSFFASFAASAFDCEVRPTVCDKRPTQSSQHAGLRGPRASRSNAEQSPPTRPSVQVVRDKGGDKQLKYVAGVKSRHCGRPMIGFLPSRTTVNGAFKREAFE